MLEPWMEILALAIVGRFVGRFVAPPRRRDGLVMIRILGVLPLESSPGRLEEGGWRGEVFEGRYGRRRFDGWGLDGLEGSGSVRRTSPSRVALDGVPVTAPPVKTRERASYDDVMGHDRHDVVGHYRAYPR